MEVIKFHQKALKTVKKARTVKLTEKQPREKPPKEIVMKPKVMKAQMKSLQTKKKSRKIPKKTPHLQSSYFQKRSLKTS